jgi:hypothetical protein
MASHPYINFPSCIFADHVPLTYDLGIDPGTNALGYGIIDIQGEEIHVLDSGTVRLAGFESQQVKLREIYLQLQEGELTPYPSLEKKRSDNQD